MICVVAERGQLLFTELALSTSDLKHGHNPLTNFEVLDIGTNSVYDSHELQGVRAMRVSKRDAGMTSSGRVPRGLGCLLVAEP